MIVELLQGRRRMSAVVNVAVAGIANAANILVISAFASMIGTKTFVIKRLKIRNNGAGNGFVHIGTGVGVGVFVEAIPPLWSISNTTADYDENDLPETEVGATITAYPDAVGAGSFDIQIEVEERG